MKRNERQRPETAEEIERAQNRLFGKPPFNRLLFNMGAKARGRKRPEKKQKEPADPRGRLF